MISIISIGYDLGATRMKRNSLNFVFIYSKDPFYRASYQRKLIANIFGRTKRPSTTSFRDVTKGLTAKAVPVAPKKKSPI